MNDRKKLTEKTQDPGKIMIMMMIIITDMSMSVHGILSFCYGRNFDKIIRPW